MRSVPKYYLDYNATAPISVEVTEAISPFIGGSFGNPSSKFNPFGQAAAAAVEQVRGSIAELLGLSAKEVVFTSGGTESCYAAFLGRMLGVGVKGGQVLISAVEHPAVIEAAKLSSQLFGVEVVEIGVDREGQLDLEQLEQELTADTHLVSVMAANNETGILPQLSAVVELASVKGVPVHTDATNFVGKLPCNFTELGVSFVSMSAHKIGGLKGVGVLGLIGGGERIGWKPIFKGGGQEAGRRGGTENVAGIVSLGAAATLKSNELRSGFPEKLRAQRDRFERLVLESISNVQINGLNSERLPNTSSFVFKNSTASELISALAEREVYVSAGSACKTGSIEISHVLKAMGVSFTDGLATLRFSFGEIMSEGDLTALVEIVSEEVKKNREETVNLAEGKS